MHIHTGTHRFNHSKSENDKILDFLFEKDTMIRAAVFGNEGNSKVRREVEDLVDSRSSRKHREPRNDREPPQRRGTMAETITRTKLTQFQQNVRPSTSSRPHAAQPAMD